MTWKNYNYRYSTYKIWGEILVCLVLKIIYLPLKSWKESIIVSKQSCHILIASIPLRFTLRLQHGQRMVITQGLTIHNYVNVISDVWKTKYSSKKPVTNTHTLSFWYWRITKISWRLISRHIKQDYLPLPFPSLLVLLLNDEIKKISIFRKKVNISAKISALKEFS